MRYIDIFRTTDRNELSIIKNLFDEENIAYRSHGEATDNAAGLAGLGNDGMRIEVEESQKDKAAQIIKRTGFLGERTNLANSSRTRPQVGKWVIFILAALVVFVAIIFFVWFMSGN
ncbi:DUF2007 domain-containing protein [Salegentibacter sp. Hel_I_6]|uniref:putative signal transducing protein n=1 Tax=Salegentibacter sp. Hel_I_6 TaxID=1250278 RepID=UPI0005633D59|nr:DUF2007 domain-containing protein [Salegentibacter sp. Hel_I_6]